MACSANHQSQLRVPPVPLSLGAPMGNLSPELWMAVVFPHAGAPMMTYQGRWYSQRFFLPIALCRSCSSDSRQRCCSSLISSRSRTRSLPNARAFCASNPASRLASLRRDHHCRPNANATKSTTASSSRTKNRYHGMMWATADATSTTLVMTVASTAIRDSRIARNCSLSAPMASPHDPDDLCDLARQDEVPCDVDPDRPEHERQHPQDREVPACQSALEAPP